MRLRPLRAGAPRFQAHSEAPLRATALPCLLAACGALALSATAEQYVGNSSVDGGTCSSGNMALCAPCGDRDSTTVRVAVFGHRGSGAVDFPIHEDPLPTIIQYCDALEKANDGADYCRNVLANFYITRIWWPWERLNATCAPMARICAAQLARFPHPEVDDRGVAIPTPTTRFPPFLERVVLRTTPHGTMLLDTRDWYIQTSVQTTGFWEKQWVDLLMTMIRPGSLVLDVGAHMGATAVPFARATGFTGRVVALEPQLPVYLQLCANAALQWDLPYVIWPLHTAAGNGSGPGWISIAALNPNVPSNRGAMSLNAAMDNSIVSGKVGGNVGTAVSQEATSVRLSSVDRLSELLPDVRHWGLRRDGCPDLIKQDVEDLEAEVMHGAAQTLKRCPDTVLAFEVLAYKSELAQELIETASRAYAAGSVDSVHAAKPCIFLSNNPSFDPARASPEERRQWPPFPAQPRYNSPNAITMPLGRLPDLCTAAWTAAANLSGALDVGQWDDDLAWAASAALCSTRAGLAEAPYDHLMLHRVEAPEVSCDVSQAPQTALDLITERVRAWERATAPERLDSTAALLRRMQEVVLRHVGHLVSDGRLRKGYLFRDYVATPLMAVVHLKSLLHYSLDQQEGMHEQALAILPDELAAKIREPNGLWYPTHAEAALIKARISLVAGG